MSLSARRLGTAVPTDRFAWQTGGGIGRAVVSLLRQTEGDDEPRPAPAPAPAGRDLPTPSPERLEAIEREAYARGYADGERAAREAAAAAAVEQARETTARLAEALQDLANVRSVLMRRSERDLVRLAVSMAGRILRREVDLDRELLVVMARVAIDRLGENVVATVHLNPDDHAIITSRGLVDPGHSVELRPDPTVPRGGCLVRSAFGTVDVGIDSQIRELSRALLGEEPEDESGTGAGA